MNENNEYYKQENQQESQQTNMNQSSSAQDAGSSYQNYNYGSNGYGTYSSPYTKKEEKKGNGLLKKATAFAICGLLFGVCAGAGFYGITQLNKYLDGQQEVMIQQDQDQEVSNVVNNDAAGSQVVNVSETKVVTSDVTEVVEDVMPGMVSIINNYVVKSTYWGRTYESEAQGSGSGVIIGEEDGELLIVTNHHVIADTKKLEVTFIDNSTAEAQVKGKNASMDLAVIAIKVDDLSEETKAAITIVELGDSDSLKLGEPVIAIGNALGYGQSVTGGWVSALNREITMEDGSKGTFIQTDAAINSGNSGGALLNIEGELIGINSSKIGGYGIEGMGYAIPITAAEPIISDLMTRETKQKVEDGKVGYMGVSLQAVSDEVIYMYNFPEGVIVLSVEDGSPAALAGILPNDIITHFDGEAISDYEDLQEELQYYAAGEKATVTVQRIGNGAFNKVDLEITLGEKPATE